MADEKIIQITTTDNHLYSLTNQGRLFVVGLDDVEWSEIPLPPLNKPKPRAQAKSEGYSDVFCSFWNKYPKGHGGNKQKACRQWEARISEPGNQGVMPMHDMFEGLKRYIKFIDATKQHVMHPATFLGRDKHYLNDFTIPDSAKRQNRVKQEWEIIPENDNHLAGFIEKHGFKQGHDRMDKVFDTRRKLQAQIKQRIERELN